MSIAVPGQASFVPTSETPILSQLGVVEGDVLSYLESRGPTSLHRLVLSQDWPSSLVVMAVGALIRQGLVRGSEQQLACVSASPPVRW